VWQSNAKQWLLRKSRGASYEEHLRDRRKEATWVSDKVRWEMFGCTKQCRTALFISSMYRGDLIVERWILILLEMIIKKSYQICEMPYATVQMSRKTLYLKLVTMLRKEKKKQSNALWFSVYPSIHFRHTCNGLMMQIGLERLGRWCWRLWFMSPFVESDLKDNLDNIITLFVFEN